MASTQAGSEVMAAVFAFPENEAERRARIGYALIFVLAKSNALALTFIPPNHELAQVLFGLSIANFLLGFLMDAAARRETKRWAGQHDSASSFWNCLLESIPGLMPCINFAGRIGGKVSRRVQNLSTQKGSISLDDEEETAVAEQTAEVKASMSAMERWIQDIRMAYEYGVLSKKFLSGTIVILRFLYDQGGYKDKRLDITARVLSSFVSLVLVDILDALSKEESRLRSKSVNNTSIFSRFTSLFG